jgi:hypothetical protein
MTVCFAVCPSASVSVKKATCSRPFAGRTFATRDPLRVTTSPVTNVTVGTTPGAATALGANGRTSCQDRLNNSRSW